MCTRPSIRAGASTGSARARRRRSRPTRSHPGCSTATSPAPASTRSRPASRRTRTPRHNLWQPADDADGNDFGAHGSVRRQGAQPRPAAVGLLPSRRVGLRCGRRRRPGRPREASPPMSVTGPHVLREYALLADGERGALIGPHGDVAWMCAPRWHDGSLFSTLAGGSGTYVVGPRGRYVWGGYYETNSLVWHSRWVTEHGIVECREALAYPGDAHRLVLRRVWCITLDCRAGIDVLLRPRADYDRRAMGGTPRTPPGWWTFRCGPLYLRWTARPGCAAPRRRTGRCASTSNAGERHDLVLEVSDQPLPDEPVDAATAWGTTEATWEKTVPTPRGTLAPRDTAHSIRGAARADQQQRGNGRGGHHQPAGTLRRRAATTTTATCGSATSASPARRARRWGPTRCWTPRSASSAGRLRDTAPNLAPAYTVTGEAVPGTAALRSARLSRRVRRRGQSGPHPVPARRVRRVVAAVRRRRSRRPARRRGRSRPRSSRPPPSRNAGGSPTPASGSSTTTAGRTAG